MCEPVDPDALGDGVEGVPEPSAFRLHDGRGGYAELAVCVQQVQSLSS